MSSILKVDTIQNTGGTTGLTIDSTGRMLTPARPAFRAKFNASGTLAAGGDMGGGNSVLVPNDVTTSGFGLHNVGSHYSTSNGKFTAPIAGLYFFQFNIYQNNTADCEIDFYLGSQNLGNARFFAQDAYSSYSTCNASTTLMLSASDEVTIKVQVGTAYFNQTVSNFSGFLIG